MHTVELLEQAIAEATRQGFSVRQEWLGGSTASACEIRGRRFIFLDLSQSPRDQLQVVLAALDQESQPTLDITSPALRTLLNLRKAA